MRNKSKYGLWPEVEHDESLNVVAFGTDAGGEIVYLVEREDGSREWLPKDALHGIDEIGDEDE